MRGWLVRMYPVRWPRVLLSSRYAAEQETVYNSNASTYSDDLQSLCGHFQKGIELED